MSIRTALARRLATAPYHGYGHGTHVAGIVAGNGADSNGARSGIAPGDVETMLRYTAHDDPRYDPLAQGAGLLDAKAADRVIWGTSNGDTVVWGASCIDPSCTPVIWDR